MKAMEKLLQVVADQTEWTNMLDTIKSMKATSLDVEIAAHEELEHRAGETAEALWNAFVEWAEIEEAEHNNYEKFDSVYDSFKNSGYIEYLTVCDDYDEVFLNPIPVKFFETLQEMDWKGKLHAVDIDKEESTVTIW